MVCHSAVATLYLSVPEIFNSQTGMDERTPSQLHFYASLHFPGLSQLFDSRNCKLEFDPELDNQ